MIVLYHLALLDSVVNSRSDHLKQNQNQKQKKQAIGQPESMHIIAWLACLPSNKEIVPSIN